MIWGWTVWIPLIWLSSANGNSTFRFPMMWLRIFRLSVKWCNTFAQVKNDKDKTPEQVLLLTSAYERNLSTLKTQQKVLEQKTDAMYKSVLTPEQYNQYKAQQLNVQDSFNNFLQK